MSRKDLTARRARNRELAKADAANRCAFCRHALPVGCLERFEDGVKFCNSECAESFEERERLMVNR